MRSEKPLNWKKIAHRKGVKNNREFPRFLHPNEDVREFLCHKRSLYPNNYLHLLEYKKLDLDEEADKYHDIIYNANNEQEIQQYIKLNHKWFIPGSIFLDYNFGHHDAYPFPEQKLGNEYAADYMLIGKSSDGYRDINLELIIAYLKDIDKQSNSKKPKTVKFPSKIKKLPNSDSYQITSLGRQFLKLTEPIFQLEQ